MYTLSAMFQNAEVEAARGVSDFFEALETQLKTMEDLKDFPGSREHILSYLGKSPISKGTVEDCVNAAQGVALGLLAQETLYKQAVLRMIFRGIAENPEKIQQYQKRAQKLIQRCHAN